MADLLRIKSNVAKMVEMNAPESDIDQYIAEEGVTVDDVRNFQTAPSQTLQRPDRLSEAFTDIKEHPFASISPTIGIFQGRMPLDNGLLKLISGVQQRYESAIANPMIATQQADPLQVKENPLQFLKQLAESSMRGVTGQERGEMGDLARNLGMGETAAGAIGMTAMAPFMGGARTLEGATNVAKSGINALKGGVAKLKEIPEAIKAIPNKFFRGGLTKMEAARVETQYGSSNGSLVDVVKSKLNQAASYADEMYRNVSKKAPGNKFINIRPAIEESGKRLKKLGLITENGNLTELGKSEIARDSTYGKLLDFYQSSDAISGVGKLAGKESVTTGQMAKLMSADRQTLVNKEQYLFLRDKLNSLYKNKPSDIDVSRVADSFYQAGENSGLKGLQEARRLEREAFSKLDKFMDNKGGLRIATEAKLDRIGTKNKLSKQEMDYIEELQKYIKHPIIEDAKKINLLNKAKLDSQRIKDVATGVGLSAAGVGIANKFRD